MSQVLPSAEPPTEERWAALGSVLLATLYLWILAWLLVAVVAPTVGFGWTPVVITSGSMEPLIRPGDVVLTSEPPLTDLAPGTVITFEDPARQGSLTTHRVVSVQDDGAYRTRGDANRAADSTPVPPEAVVGVGRLLVPMVGLPLLWLSGGLLLFVIWLGVTLAATAVAVQRGDGADRETPPSGGTPTPRTRRTPVRPSRVPVVRPALGAAMRRLRPRNAQRAILAFTRRVMNAWLRRVLPAARPVAGRVRAWLPVTIVAVAGGVGARTPVTISVAAALGMLVLVLDPRGPELRIGRWHRNSVHAAQMVMTVLPTALLGRFAVALVVVGLLSSTSLGRSAAVFSAATSTTGSSFAASTSFPVDPPPDPDTTTFWLQTSPEGEDTTSQKTLPFATTAPTETVLYNYDTDRDTDPGLTIKKTKSGDLPDPTKADATQHWAMALAADVTISEARIVFHSATKAYDPGKGANIHWYLWDCLPGGTSCVDLGTATVSRADWQSGSDTFVEDVATWSGLSHTISAGRELRLVGGMQDVPPGVDHWFAYGTVAQPSRLELTTAAPPPPPPPPPSDGTTFWLQTSPEGQDTTAQARLPFATTAPTETTLYNYDTDRDAFPGLLVAKGGVGPSEADAVKAQRWTYSVSDGQTLVDPDVVFWSATKDFSQGVSWQVDWHLRDCAVGGGGCVEIASASVSRADWQQGSATWVEDTADFGSLSYTFGAGRELQAVVTVDSVSGDDHWFAYGTVGQPSRLEFTTPPPPPPPPSDGTTFWLQTSVEGQDTNAQLTLPFATTAPTQTTLYNYSANMDSEPGRLVKRKGQGAFETDWKLIQRWSQTLPADLTLSGAQLRIFSATRNFQQAKASTLHFFLGDCAAGGTGCSVLASTDLSRADWQGGNTGWVEDTVDFGPLSVTLSAGRELWVAVTVDNVSGDEHWFAYDTVGQPSRLELTSPAAGSCPGTGSATVIASEDTYVLQSDPTANFSTQKQVWVQSKLAENARTLLTFALPTLPAGCSVTAATLTMETVTSKQGRTYEVARADSAVAPATVTWADQPTATGAIGTGPSTGNGPTPLDATAPVQELYTLGNTGLVVRDAVEDSGGTDTNKYSSLEEAGKPQPRLTVVWGS